MRQLHYMLMLAAAVALATGCQRSGDDGKAAAARAAAASAFAQSEQQWRDQRREHLLAPDGWASLVGLHWIDPGSHYLGSDADNGIRLAMGPEHMGMLDLEGKQVRFVPDQAATLTLDGQPLTTAASLRTDMAEAGPSVVGFDDGKGQLTVIERAGRYALRVKHADAPTRVHFAGLDYWPADAAWKVEGTFVPHPAGQTIEIASIIGTTDQVPNPGAIEFTRDGRTYRIEAQDEGEGERRARRELVGVDSGQRIAHRGEHLEHLVEATDREDLRDDRLQAGDQDAPMPGTHLPRCDHQHAQAHAADVFDAREVEQQRGNVGTSPKRRKSGLEVCRRRLVDASGGYDESDVSELAGFHVHGRASFAFGVAGARLYGPGCFRAPPPRWATA